MANGLPSKGQIIDGFRYLGGDPNDEASWAPESGLKAGMITDGYRYIGGDPNSEKSWQPVELEQGTRSGFAVANDLVIDAANMALGGVKAITDFVAPGNRVGQSIEGLIESGRKSQSDITQARDRAFQAQIEGAEGFGEEAGIAARYALENPGRVAAMAAGAYAVPGLAMKGVGRGSQALGLTEKATGRAQLATGSAVGGAMAGGDAGGQAYDLVMNMTDEVLAKSPEYQTLVEGGMDPQAAREKLATDAARAASALPAVIGAASGAVGVERLMSGGKGFAGGVLSRGAKTGTVEAVTEGFEEGVTGYSGRAAAAQIDPNIDPMKGVGAEAVLGAATGFVPGAVLGGLDAAVEPSKQRQLLAEEKLKSAQNAGEAAAAAVELADSVTALEPAVDAYLNPDSSIPTPQQAAAMPAPQAAGLQEDPTRAMIDRQAGLIAQAQAAPTEFDRQMALDQAQTALPQPTEGRSAGFVDLTPMDGMQAQQRLAILRDETARAGGNALALAVVPHPAQEGRFAIVEQALPDLNLPQQTPTIAPDQAQFQIEQAALGGQVNQARAEDTATRGPIIDRALKNVEERGGVATPDEARIFQEAGMGTPYDRVDPNLGTQPAPLIETAGSARESSNPNQRIADEEVQADQQARRLSDRAQQDRQLQGQIDAAGQARPAPDAGAVISALVTPGTQRSAEQVRIVNEARNRYSPQDFNILERAANAPFQLNTEERMRLRTLRNPPAVTETSTNVPESGTGLMGTRVAERLGQPSNGRIITTGAKFSTQRAAPGGKISINDGGTQHEVRIVEPSRLGVQGRLLQQIARLFNKRLVAFESSTLQADGFVRDGDNESIYINAQSQMSVLAVFGHELTHQLKRDNPQAYAALEAVVRRELREGATSEFEQDTGYDADASLEELTSDLVGNRFQEADFWQSVFDEIAAQNPEGARGIITRLAAAINRAINAFRKFVTQPGFDSDQYVNDIDAVKKAVNQALVSYMRQQGPAAQQSTGEVTGEVAGEAQPAARPSLAERLREAARGARTEMGETVTASNARKQGAPYNVSDTNSGAANARFSEPRRDSGLPADAGQDRPGVGKTGGDQIPSYGQAREGAVSVVGRHYSRAERQSLSGAFYGTGLRGAEARRLADSPDPRLRQRIYFYVDKGQGVRPEAGVGSIAHEVRLDNIYDPSSGLIPPQEDANSFESAVINAGFDGYLAPFGGQDAVVLLGPKHTSVPVQPVNAGAQFSRARSSVEIVRNPAKFKDQYGLKPGKNSTRSIGEALNKDTLDRFGQISDTDNSEAARDEIAGAMADEVIFQLGKIRSSGVGWYSKNYPKALKNLGRIYPELQKSKGARATFTAFLAISSNGEKVTRNVAMARQLYETWRTGGNITKAIPGTKRQAALDGNVRLMADLLKKYGPNGVSKVLLEEMTVSEINKQLRAVGEKPQSGYPADMTLPRAALYFGPKLGAFYANLMGSHGYLTMDLWWSRTFNRMRGTLLPQPTQGAIDYLRNAFGEPDATVERLVELAEPYQESYIAKNYKDGTELEKRANTFMKAAVQELNEAPFRGSDRKFMAQTAERTQELLKDAGYDLTIADIQAALWYYEKRLYGALGSRIVGDIGYLEALENASETDRPERSTARSGGESSVSTDTGSPSAEDAGDVPAQDATFSRSGRGRDGAGRDQSGSLAPLPGAPVIEGASGPDPRLVEVAEQYAKENGIDLQRQAEYVQVDPARAARIAAAYEAMPHAPQDARVKEAYQDLIRQTVAQYRALEQAGYKFYFFDEANDPYQGNPWNAMRDLRANQRMGVFATEAGFGSGATDLNVDDNPLLADTGIRWAYGSEDGPLKRVLANDLFRAVHDAFGHGLEGAGFRAQGEENAWQAHVRLFTGDAVGAITTETRGQNSWLNYGPYGDRNRNAKVEDTVFADQKTGLMPEWTWSEGRAGDAQLSRQRNPQVDTPAFKRWFGDSKIVDENGDPLVMYHGTTGDFNTFRRSPRGAYFVSPDPDFASGFTEDVEDGQTVVKDGGNVMPVYVRAERPFDYENRDHVDQVMQLAKLPASVDKETVRNSIEDGSWGFIEDRDIQRAIKAAGFDSFYISEYGVKNLAVYEQTQLKSATGNQGTFDPTNADITQSRRRNPQVDTPAFKRWFGDSKVVDENGDPLVVYHGSPSEFYEFDPYASMDGGFYFTEDRRLGESFAKDEDGELITLHEVYLSLQNPKTIDLRGEQQPDQDAMRAMFEQAKAEGYDGVALLNVREFNGTGTQYVAFRPEQIKSAVSNEGTFDPTKADIRKSRRRNYGSLTAAQEQALRNVGGIVPDQTVGDRMKELGSKFKKSWFSGIFDQFAPLKDVDQRAYMLARLSKGSDGALEALMLYGKPYMNGDVPDVNVNDEGFIEVMASLKGEHDRFLWWVAAQRAENLKAQGRENLFTDQDISSLKSLNQGKFDDGTPRAQAYANALAKMNDFNDAVLNIAEQSGLIDGQARQLFKDMPYVPFYRVMEDGVEGPSFSSGLVNQQAWKKLKGGTQKLNEDLLSNVLLNWAHLFDAAGKNRAAVASMQAATQIGIAQQVPAGTKGAVKVMEQGQTQHYTIDDPYIMEAVTALNYQPPGFFSPFSTFKKWLTIGVTASPTFKIKNLMRDSLQAIGTAPMSYNVASNVMKGFKKGSKETQTFASMLAGGGLIRFGSMLDGTSRTQYMIERQGGILLNEGGWAKLQRQMTGLVEAYAELGDRLENVNRVSLYEHLLSKGYSQAEANFMSRDLMDFSLQGRWPVVRFLAQSVPFLNARLQGLSKLGRGAKDDTRRFGYVVGAVALASIALMLAYEDDEDWKKRPDWDRDTNWWFKIGGTAFRIPKPFEIGAIGTVAERTWELAFNKEMSWKRYRQRLSHMIFETFAMDPTPQLVVPISEIYANREGFTGRPIEGMGLQKLRPEDRATESTSSVARMLGQMGLPNPVALVKGNYEKLSPVQIDHLIRGYFGWIGSTATTILDFGLRPLMDRGERPAYRLKDVFVVGNFAEGLPANSSRYVEQLYEQARVVEQAYMSYQDAVKKGDRNKARELMAEEGDKIRAYKAINKISDQVSEINRKIRQIEASRSLSAETKRKMIDQLSQRKDLIARRSQRAITLE